MRTLNYTVMQLNKIKSMSLASCHTSLMFVSKAEADLSGAPYRLPKRHNTQHNDTQFNGLICNTRHN